MKVYGWCRMPHRAKPRSVTLGDVSHHRGVDQQPKRSIDVQLRFFDAAGDSLVLQFTDDEWSKLLDEVSKRRAPLRVEGES